MIKNKLFFSVFVLCFSVPSYSQEVKTTKIKKEDHRQITHDVNSGTIYIHREFLGDFVHDFEKSLKAVVVDAGHKKVILDLDSRGGSVRIMKIAMIQLEIYKNKYNVTFESTVRPKNRCGSACTAFAMSANSFNIHDKSRWLFHSPWVKEFSIPENFILAEKLYIKYYVKKLQNLDRSFFISKYEKVCKNKNLEKFITNGEDNFITGLKFKKLCPTLR